MEDESVIIKSERNFIFDYRDQFVHYNFKPGVFFLSSDLLNVSHSCSHLQEFLGLNLHFLVVDMHSLQNALFFSLISF